MTVPIQEQPRPILLFDDECGVCRRIAGWVRRSARLETGQSSIVVRPIGSDPGALRALNPDLDIWTAYATIHVVMPDGSMKLGGEAIAEVLRSLPRAKWFAWSFAITIFGFRPFQMLLNLAYAVLADVRPIFGCESCGTPSPWVKPIHWMLNWGKVGASPTPHFTSLSAARRT
jgi:predicted DCC family thiol-disulfide oxidoreductase YuxK